MPDAIPDRPASASPTAGELEGLVARADEAERRTLEFWMKAVVSSSSGSMTVRQMQESVSWRITRPLRAVRIVYDRVRQVGVRRTMDTIRERLAQLRQARRRG